MKTFILLLPFVLVPLYIMFGYTLSEFNVLNWESFRIYQLIIVSFMFNFLLTTVITEYFKKK